MAITSSTPIADEAAAATTPAPADAPAPQPTFTAGEFVRDDNGRIGIVTDKGREPGEGEGPEPLVLWLPGEATPYGAGVTSLTQ